MTEQSRNSNIGGSEGFGERWGWIATLDNLCNGDFTKRPHYEKMNVIEFLNICSFVKEKQKAEAGTEVEWMNLKEDERRTSNTTWLNYRSA